MTGRCTAKSRGRCDPPGVVGAGVVLAGVVGAATRITCTRHTGATVLCKALTACRAQTTHIQGTGIASSRSLTRSCCLRRSCWVHERGGWGCRTQRCSGGMTGRSSAAKGKVRALTAARHRTHRLQETGFASDALPHLELSLSASLGQAWSALQRQARSVEQLGIGPGWKQRSMQDSGWLQTGNRGGLMLQECPCASLCTVPHRVLSWPGSLVLVWLGQGW